MTDPLRDNTETQQQKAPTPIIGGEEGLFTDGKALSRDIHCRSCGYNLRGLMTDGLCPECGAAVDDSLNENFLRYSALSLVRKMSKGVNLTFGCLKWFLIAILLLTIINVVQINIGSLMPVSIPLTVIFIIIGIILLPVFLLPILYPLGWWWATTPDPVDDPKLRRQRVILRWTAIGFVFTVPIWISIYGYGFMASPIGTVFSGLNWLREIITHTFFIIVWFHLFAMNCFMRDVMSRCAPNAKEPNFAKHIRALSKNRKWIRNMSVVLLALHWIGIVFHYWVFPMKGLPAGGVFFGSGIGYFWILLLWVFTVGMLSYITGPVRDEYLIAQGFHDDKLESS